MYFRKVVGNRKVECGSVGKLYLNYKVGREGLQINGKVFRVVYKD